jgi:putative photosynthetic complex assembly protein 2
MIQHALPALYAVAVWWAGTALIFVLDQLSPRSFRRSFAIASLVLFAALWCIVDLADRRTVGAAYAGFTCGVLVWAWQELAFLTGLVTGPNRESLPEGCTGWPRFRRAVMAILHHELTILALGLALLALLWRAENSVALHTYALLWIMRQSAKLNVFLGARNLGEGMMPPHLAYIGSYFRRRRMNALFPFSILGGLALTVFLGVRAAGGDAFEMTAYTLLTTMSALAVLEHVFLMAPLPLDGLWTWGRPAPQPVALRPQRPDTATLPLRP